MSGSRLGKYLLYAVGEVLLIVLGVLIALGIDNWNQDRLNREKEQFYLSGLQTEFESSRRKLENLIEVNRSNFEGAKIIAGFITQEIPPDESRLSELLFQAFSNEIAFNPNTSLLNELINSGGLKEISNAELRKHLTAWDAFMQTIRRQEAALSDQRERVLEIFQSDAASIRTIFDDVGITSGEMGLAKSPDHMSNLKILKSRAFENNLLLFITTGMTTETVHYQPLLAEIDLILGLVRKEIKE